MSPRATLMTLASLAAVLAGCTSSSGSGTASTAASAPPGTTAAITVSQPPVATTTSTTVPASTITSPNCPSDGGSCRGNLDAGTYQTTRFIPRLTYTVPAGWMNFEDTGGNFSLVPPGGDWPGVNAGTSDYIGVYTKVSAEAKGCTPEVVEPGVGSAPQDIARWVAEQKGLIVTAPTPAAVGGLSGVVVTVKLAPGGGQLCPGDASPYFPILTGQPPTGLDNGVSGKIVLRLYLLAFGGGTLAIEINDVASGGAQLSAYEAVVQTFKFGS